MNIVKKYGILPVFLLFNASLFAEDIITAFLDKHGNDDNLEVISIGKSMIDKMCGLTAENLELKKTLESLDNIRVIHTTDSVISSEYFDSAIQIKDENAEYKEVEAIENMSVLIRKSKEKVREVLLLINDESGFNMISIRGEIDMNNLLAYSDKIGIKNLKDIQLKQNN
jgi:hypothetical protein